jgi:multidrug transporter EmrE-like cation transporter
LGTVLNFTVYRLDAPLSAAGPMILLGGVIIMAAAGVLLFNESLTFSRSAGWVLAIIAIWLLSR